MDSKAYKTIFLLLGTFLIGMVATAALTIESIVLSPASPEKDDNLQCKFTLDDDSNYTVTWYKNNNEYVNEEGTAAADVQETVTLSSSATSIGEDWKCMVTADSEQKTSNTVEIISENKLIISDISAKCSPKCDDDDLDEDKAMNGFAGTIKEVKPGATLTLSVRVENIWPEDTDDHDIEDIELECTLEDIADEDEQDETIDFEDLDPDERSDKEQMEFDITVEAEEEVYQIDCNLIGDDEDGTNYDIDFEIEIDVEKEKHDVVFTKSLVNPSTVGCSRDFQLTYEVKNIGGKDEEDVQVVIRNTELGIFRNDVISELEEGDYDDEDTEYSRSYNFNVANDVKAGTYRIDLEVFFDDGDEQEWGEVELIVQDCGAVEPEEEEEEEPEEPEEEVEVIQGPDTAPTQTTGPVVAIPTTMVTAEDKVTFTNSIWFLVLLAVVVLILLGLAILLVVLIVRK